MTPLATQFRLQALTLCAAPLAITVALWFVLPTSWDDQPPVLLAAAMLALVALGFVLAETLGFRTPPLTPADGADEAALLETSRLRFQTLSVLRFVVTEAPIIVGIAVSFVADHGLWPFFLTVVPGLPLMLVATWPSRRNVAKVTAALESGGVRSGLPEAFGQA